MEIVSVRENVDLIRDGEREIYLVGTAHVSHASVELVERTIRDIKPDTVAVELCQSRFDSLSNPDRWKQTDIVEVLRSGKGYVLLSQLMLVSFQKRLGEKLKIKPGEEMMRAVQVANELCSQLVLADREVRITLKRSWAGLSIFGMSRLVAAMVHGLFSKEAVTEEEIERLKSSDALEETLREFGEVMPQVRLALIDERDRFLISKIREAPGRKIVAVIGAGHVPGMKRYFETPIDREELNKIPKKGILLRVINWGVPLLIMLLVLIGISKSGARGGVDMVTSWALVTGGFAAAGAALALAHPVSILLAFIAGPLTPLNPIIKAGRVAALSEAVLRKPRVSDFETIADDMGSVRGIFRNRVSNILVVLCFTTILNWVGIVWGAKVLASLL